MKNSYVFYFPYRGFGGVPILFLRVAEKLAQQGFKCSVIDYDDGYMAKNKSAQIELVSCKSKTIKIPEKSILIFQSDLPWGIPRNIETHPETTVFFWNCYPFNLIPVPPAPFNHYVSSRLFLAKLLLLTAMREARKKTVALLQDLMNFDAIAFMDEANRKTSEFALSYSPITNRFLPVLVNGTDQMSAQDLIQQQTLTVAWVGRVADFKINSLYRIIKDLADLKISRKIKMIIVGDGKYLQALKDFCTHYPHIEFEFIPSIVSKEIPSFLNQKIDLLCAMGTSALEGGLAKVPTLLLDFSYTDIPSGYQYQFLYDTQFFNLGRPVDSKLLKKTSNLEKKIQMVLDQKQSEAQKCYNYVIHNHSVDEKIGYFIKLSQNSSLNYNDLVSRPYLKKPWLYQLRAKILNFFNLK